MSDSPDTGRAVLRLLEVSQRIERDSKERRALIRLLLDAGFGVREVSRISGLSSAQISRYNTGKVKL